MTGIRVRALLLAALALSVPCAAEAKGRAFCAACARDNHGRIERSTAAKHVFEAETGHPKGWPGHVVDHVIALKRGGPDVPANMQWQTIAAAKAKDRWE